MTVREYVEKLQKLDQDKNIWQIYDFCEVWEPEVTHLVGNDAEYVEMFADKGVKEGDYALLAG